VDSAVAGLHPEEQSEVLRAAFGVHAAPCAIDGRGDLPQRDVGVTQCREQRQQGGRVVVRGAETRRPGFLVVTLERRLVLRQDPAIPGRSDKLGFGHVAEAFENGPFALGRARSDVGAGTIDQLAPGRHLGRLYFERIVPS